MSNYTKERFEEVLYKHSEYIKGNVKGERADLPGVNLSGAALSGVGLSGANLYEANLYEANLYEANLDGAKLSRANLSRTNLARASLSWADLSRATLSGTDLFEAALLGTDFSNTVVKAFYIGNHFGFMYGRRVKIGCIELSLDKWIKEYKDVGKTNGYSKEQIYNYGIMLKALKKMK